MTPESQKLLDAFDEAAEDYYGDSVGRDVYQAAKAALVAHIEGLEGELSEYRQAEVVVTYTRI